MSRPETGDPVFNDYADGRIARPLTETCLVRCLRTWHKDPNAMVREGRSLLDEICSLLEGYICQCISYQTKRLRGWWSDGVVYLEIAEPHADRFTLVGVTWIDSLGTAPFEIDVELDPRDDIYFAKTVFRIGLIDPSGRPMVCNRDLPPKRILEMRPRISRDWAMAIELRSPARNATKEFDPDS